MKEYVSPLKAIRLHCMDCSNQQYKEVELCPCTDCNLYPFRFGKNPNRAGLVNKGTFKKQSGSTCSSEGCEIILEESSTEEVGISE